MVLITPEHDLHRAILHHASRIDHGDRIAELCHNTQVMGDEHDGSVELLPQLLHQL